MLWNLSALAQALLPLIEKSRLEAELDRFEELYEAAKLKRMRARLGLQAPRSDDADLIVRLESIWTEQRMDHNRFLRHLCEWQPGDTSSTNSLLALARQEKAVADWLRQYEMRLEYEAASNSDPSGTDALGQSALYFAQLYGGRSHSRSSIRATTVH